MGFSFLVTINERKFFGFSFISGIRVSQSHPPSRFPKESQPFLLLTYQAESSAPSHSPLFVFFFKLTINIIFFILTTVDRNINHKVLFISPCFSNNDALHSFIHSIPLSLLLYVMLGSIEIFCVFHPFAFIRVLLFPNIKFNPPHRLTEITLRYSSYKIHFSKQRSKIILLDWIGYGKKRGQPIQVTHKSKLRENFQPSTKLIR